MSEADLLTGLPSESIGESARSWVQLGLVPVRDQWTAVYASLDELASAMLDRKFISDFFFMHKPPALRVRFHTGVENREVCGAELRTRIYAWRDRGLLDDVTGGVYEPEQHLFGGPASMRHVHRLFTADALAWLSFHATQCPGPRWAFSLTLLRAVLDGLEVVGWEDLDVWDRIQRQTGRVLPSKMDNEKTATAAAGVRMAWLDSSRLSAALSAQANAIAATYAPRLRSVAAAWLQAYFQGDDALIGPREAAAFFTIFHWNRGRMPLSTQMLIAAALADRGARP